MTENASDDRDSTDDEYVEPDLPTEPDAGDDGPPALSPEDLDIADSEYVEPLDDKGRYVVSSGGGPPKVPNSLSEGGTDDGGEKRAKPSGIDRTDSSEVDRQSRGAIESPEAARTLLAEELTRSNARYGIDVVGRFEGNTVRHRTASDDVIATFENLVLWYARHVSDGTPADEVLGILLREANFLDPETPNLAKLLESHDLDRTDSIEDLVTAIREESARE